MHLELWSDPAPEVGPCCWFRSYFCKCSMRNARVSLFVFGSSLMAWYRMVLLLSSSAISEIRKSKTFVL